MGKPSGIQNTLHSESSKTKKKHLSGKLPWTIIVKKVLLKHIPPFHLYIVCGDFKIITSKLNNSAEAMTHKARNIYYLLTPNLEWAGQVIRDNISAHNKNSEDLQAVL